MCNIENIFKSWLDGVVTFTSSSVNPRTYATLLTRYKQQSERRLWKITSLNNFAQRKVTHLEPFS